MPKDWTQPVDDGLRRQLTEWRRHLHATPELSFEELETTDFVARLLDGWNVPYGRPLTTGLVGHIKGAKPGPTIAVRCDLDALPIQEENTFEFKSRFQGRMHACGHDGHTAILLGLAYALCRMQSDLQGEVRLLFQPAEESTSSGAAQFIEKGVLDGVQAIIGLHLWSDLETGKISLRDGAIMASVDDFTITIVGAGGHGGSPHQTVDALVVASTLVGELQTVVSRRVDPIEPAVLTIGSLHAGTGTNVIAGQAEMTGTVRALSEPVRDSIEAGLRSLTEGHCRAHGAEAQFTYRRVSPSVSNNSELIGFLRPAAVGVVGSDRVVSMPPAMLGEDFAFYSQVAPAAFAWVGARNADVGANFPHHHPRFTIDEAALEIGLRFFLEAVQRYSSQGG